MEFTGIFIPIKYRGSHGNLRLWRECKPPQLFGVSGAVLVEAGSSRLYRREYVHPYEKKRF